MNRDFPEQEYKKHWSRQGELESTRFFDSESQLVVSIFYYSSGQKKSQSFSTMHNKPINIRTYWYESGQKKQNMNMMIEDISMVGVTNGMKMVTLLAKHF